jgi:hypothetical protein
MRTRTSPIETMDSGDRQIVLAVAERLMETSIDQIVNYEVLAAAADCDDIDQARWIVMAALKLVNKESGAVFANERKIGYRRLSSEAGVKHAGEKGLKRTRSAARNGQRVLTNAIHHANDLSPTEQRTANQRLAVFGLVEHLTRAKIVKTMPDQAPERPDPLAGLKAALGVE